MEKDVSITVADRAGQHSGQLGSGLPNSTLAGADGGFGAQISQNPFFTAVSYQSSAMDSLTL